jgi:hypothetical protein
MPSIIYYSSKCNKCIELLNAIGDKKLENTMYFSVDSRVVDGNKTYLILSNGQRVLLPVNVTSVPSLLDIDESTNKNTLFVGSQINSRLNLTASNTNTNTNTNTNNYDNSNEPSSYQIDSQHYKSVNSDTYSFLDTTPDDLLAAGDGGLKQLYNYSTLDGMHTITTPPDTYIPNTISNDNKSIDDIKTEREQQMQSI